MSVIKWEIDGEGKWQGHLGWCHVATAGCYQSPTGQDVFALSILEDFPGSIAFVSPHGSIEECKEAAEDCLLEWMEAAGLVSQEALYAATDDALEADMGDAA